MTIKKTFKQFVMDEEYVTMAKNPLSTMTTHEIYKNPSKSEMAAIMKGERESGGSLPIRFLIDLRSPQKDIYVFYYFLLHQSAKDELKLKKTINGTGTYRNGKIYIEGLLQQDTPKSDQYLLFPSDVPRDKYKEYFHKTYGYITNNHLFDLSEFDKLLLTI